MAKYDPAPAGQHGGYRRPTKPAAISGPSKLSQRTDGKPGEPGGQPMRVAPGGNYGDATEMASLQSAAPMSSTQPTSAPPGGGSAPPAFQGQMPTPLNAPSERPTEPVTHGADVGPGAGSSILGLDKVQSDKAAADVQSARRYLPLIEPFANQPGVPDSVRKLVQFIKNG